MKALLSDVYTSIRIPKIIAPAELISALRQYYMQ